MIDCIFFRTFAPRKRVEHVNELTKGVLAIMPAEIIPMNLMQVMLP
jgi:hypothetical protein